MRTPRVLALGVTAAGACRRLLDAVGAPRQRRRAHQAQHRATRPASPRARRPAVGRGVGRGQGADQDRLGQLLRVQARGRDLRPGPRERRLHGRAQLRPRLAPGADPDAGRRPDRPGPGVRRLGPRLLRQDQDHRRRPGERHGPPGRIVAGKGIDRPRHLARARTRTRSSSAPTRDEQEPRPRSATSPRSRTRSSGACRPTATRTRSARARSRTYGITYPPKQRQALGACDVADGPGPPGQGDRHRRALLDPAGHRPVRLHVLDDDKKTQPAENIAPLVRNDYLAKVDDDRLPGAPRRGVRPRSRPTS